MYILSVALLLASPEPPVTAQLPVARFAEGLFMFDPSYKKMWEEDNAVLFEPGKRERGWSKRGLSVDEIYALNGGSAATHLFLENEEGRPSLSLHVDDPLVLPGFDYRYSVDPLPEGGERDHFYFGVAEGVVLHHIGRERRVGNAICSEDTAVEVLSTKPREKWGIELTTQVMMLAHFGTEMAELTFCSVYEEAEEGRYSPLEYDPDGRPYPEINKDRQVYSVMSREEAIAAFLAANTG